MDNKGAVLGRGRSRGGQSVATYVKGGATYAKGGGSTSRGRTRRGSVGSAGGALPNRTGLSASSSSSSFSSCGSSASPPPPPSPSAAPCCCSPSSSLPSRGGGGGSRLHRTSRGEGCRGELQTVKSGYAPVTFFKSQVKFTKFLMNYSREAIMALSASIERSLGGNKPACLSLHESKRRFGRGKLRSHHTDADSVGQ